jgi:putative transposase
MRYNYKQFYRRKLPHRHSPGSTLFVTYRLRDSIPRAVIEKRKEELRLLNVERLRLKAREPNWQLVVDELEKRFSRRWFKNFDDALHLERGPLWLKDPAIAEVVANSLHHHNGSSYSLHAFCIMANHVHTLFTPFLNERSLHEIRGTPLRFESDDPTLDVIMKSLKGYTAREANRILGRKGQFWEPESYDHEVRDGQEFVRIKNYILNNPVKARLISDWRDWKWSWVDPSLDPGKSLEINKP